MVVCVCVWGGEMRNSEVSLILHLCAKVLLVLAEPGLAHLRVLRHVGQRVGADDVAIKTESVIELPAFALTSKAAVPAETRLTSSYTMSLSSSMVSGGGLMRT